LKTVAAHAHTYKKLYNSARDDHFVKRVIASVDAISIDSSVF
jgi:hypothetical protein